MNLIDVTLREALPQDASDVLKALRQLNDETPFLLVNDQALEMTTETMAHEIEHTLQLNNHIILLACHHDKIIGIATVTSESDTAMQHIGEVGISIFKEYWGIGLGTIMLKELIHWASSNKISKRLEIKVQQRNTRALSLYQRIGFELEGIIRRGFLSEENDYLDIVLLSYLI